MCLTRKIRRRLAGEPFAHAQGQTDKPLKISLSNPLMPALVWVSEHSTAVYTAPFALFADILSQAIQELADPGDLYIQITGPELAQRAW